MRQRPGEVVRGVDLVGVDEGEVEGPGPLGLEPRQLLQRRPDPYLDYVAEAGRGDACRRHLGVARIGLERDQATTGRQRPRQPDRAVASQGAELEDRLRADRLGQEMEELALG